MIAKMCAFVPYGDVVYKTDTFQTIFKQNSSKINILNAWIWKDNWDFFVHGVIFLGSLWTRDM